MPRRAGHPKPDADLAAAASKLLKPYLRAVCDLAAVRTAASTANNEHFHELRRATRRAEAVLLLYKPHARKHAYKSLRRAIRTLRRAAGPIRDNAVLLRLIRTAARSNPAFRPASRHLTRVLNARRDELELALADHTGPRAARHLRHRTNNLLRSLHRSAARVTVLEATGAALLRAIARTRQAAQRSTADPENLHRLRRRLKSVRFILELTGPSVHGSKPLQASAARLTKVLGAANDRHLLTFFLQEPLGALPSGPTAGSCAALLRRARSDAKSATTAARALTDRAPLRRFLQHAAALADSAQIRHTRN